MTSKHIPLENAPAAGSSWPVVGRRCRRHVGRESNAAPAGAGELPTIALGQYRVSRLIVGANPLAGYSYLAPRWTAK